MVLGEWLIEGVVYGDVVSRGSVLWWVWAWTALTVPKGQPRRHYRNWAQRNPYCPGPKGNINAKAPSHFKGHPHSSQVPLGQGFSNLSLHQNHMESY